MARDEDLSRLRLQTVLAPLAKRSTCSKSRERQGALSIYEKNPENSVVAKVEFPIGKKLFYLVVNPGTWPGARPWTWNWYKLQETSMEHDIPFGNSNRENGTTFLDFPLFLGIFQWDEPTKRVPFTAEPDIPEILTKWKAPEVTNVEKVQIQRKSYTSIHKYYKVSTVSV